MNYGDFITMSDDFIDKKGLTTKLPWFVNLARSAMQRRHDFAFTRTVASVSYPSTSGVGVALPEDFKGFYGDNAVSIISGSLTTPLEATTEERERRRLSDTTLQRYDSYGNLTSQTRVYTSQATPPARYYSVPGTLLHTLFIVPEQLSASLQVIYYRYLPPYTNNNEEDAILKYGSDWLLWEVIKIANTYLFDEDRIQFNQAAAMQAQSDFCEWDHTMSRGNVPIDMD